MLEKNNNNQYSDIENNEKIIRKTKLINMKKTGFSFPNNFKKKTTIEEINQKYKHKNIHELEALNITVSIAGRMTQRRIIGKASFFTLQDIEGKIQIYIKEKKYHLNFIKIILKNGTLETF